MTKPGDRVADVYRVFGQAHETQRTGTVVAINDIFVGIRWDDTGKVSGCLLPCSRIQPVTLS